MINIAQFIVLLVCAYLLFRVWGELRVISSDTRKKEELNDALDKFAALYIAKKGKEKVISFKTKETTDDE
jgi:hypothetical protein